MKIILRLCCAVLIILILLILKGCKPDVKHTTIYTIGDSTMADKRPEVYPETGWCQSFAELLTENATLRNMAVNGRSTKSFIDEGRWQKVMDNLAPGDYVFIQFGHNDQKKEDPSRYAEPHTAYKANLERFIRETKEKNATPLLFTSIIRRVFDENGKLVDTHGVYPDVVRETARLNKTVLVDLELLTGEAIQQMGDEVSKRIYLWTEPDDKYPGGRRDNTHLSKEGAELVSKLVASELKRMKHPLGRYLK